jgi:hypothetical protein
MVDVIGRAKVIVEGDVDSASINRAGGKIGDTLKRTAVIGGAALGTLAVAGYKAFQAFETAEAQSRKLNQVLANMGQSDAGPKVAKLADELSRLTAVDDEVIQQGQTVLATFSQVAESAGQTGGVFERATIAAVDLAATGFGTVESASVMLGKALQDPEKGISALGRAGVTFTESQKELIKSLVDTGEMGKAQAIILGEVEKQVGGTAEATKTESESIRIAFGELQESAGHLIAELGGEGGKGGGLSGAIYGVADALNETAESEAWGSLGENLRGTSGDVKDLGSGLFDLDVQIGKAILSIPGFGDALLGIAAPVTSTIGVLSKLVGKIQDAVEWFQRLNAATPGNTLSATAADREFELRAVGGPASGLTWVGERGPELLNLPNGSYVHSNANSEQMVSGSGGNVFNITTTGTVDDIVRELDWWARFGLVTANA